MKGKIWKSLLLVLLMCCAAQISYAQSTQVGSASRSSREESREIETIFRSVEQMPQFPGGESALMEWIAAQIHYPVEAVEEGVQGRVTVQFVVTKDGSIGQVNVICGRHPALDKEAVRVVKTLPKFIPGKMSGQAVNVWYTLPINFSLE